MLRTLSLRSLLIAVAAVCVLAALSVTFFEPAFVLVLIAGHSFPALVLIGVLTKYSPRRRLTALVGIFGALTGFFIGLVLANQYVGNPLPTKLHLVHSSMIIAISAGVAFILGVTTLLPFPFPPSRPDA